MKTNLKTFLLTEEEIEVLEDMLFCENLKEELIKNFSIRNDIWKKCLKQRDFEAELREILEWNGKPLNPLWHQQIVGQKKLAREILGEK